MIWARPLARLSRPKRADAWEASGEARRAKRHTTDTIACAIGEVVDLSDSGVRLRCDGKPPIRVGLAVPLTLTFPRGKLQLWAQARWIRRKSRLRGPYEIGLKFEQLTPAHRKALESLAKFGFVARNGAGIGEGRGGWSLGGDEGAKAEPVDIRATVDLPDHYAVLGLRRGASLAEIKHAFRELAQQYHPDHNPSPEAVARFLEIKDAYAVLSDAQRRQTLNHHVK